MHVLNIDDLAKRGHDTHADEQYQKETCTLLNKRELLFILLTKLYILVAMLAGGGVVVVIKFIFTILSAA